MPVRRFAFALLALVATGCAPVASEQPPSISVDVTQGRTDRDSRVIVLDLTNTGSEPIVLVRARLVAAQFTEPAVWSRGTTLKPGLTVSLRAPLADPVCPAPMSAPSVIVTYLDSGGQSHVATVVPIQSTEVLSTIEKDDCIAVLSAQRADIRVGDTLDWTPGAHEAAQLHLLAEPTGDGLIEILEARATILLALVDESGSRFESLPLNLAVDSASGPQEFTLRLVPARCDPHAIAEDKRGTIMVLAVQLDDGTEGLVYVRSSDAVKAELFAFVTDYCA